MDESSLSPPPETDLLGLIRDEIKEERRDAAERDRELLKMRVSSQKDVFDIISLSHMYATSSENPMDAYHAEEHRIPFENTGLVGISEEMEVLVVDVLSISLFREEPLFNRHIANATELSDYINLLVESHCPSVKLVYLLTNRQGEYDFKTSRSVNTMYINMATFVDQTFRSQGRNDNDPETFRIGSLCAMDISRPMIIWQESDMVDDPGHIIQVNPIYIAPNKTARVITSETWDQSTLGFSCAEKLSRVLNWERNHNTDVFARGVRKWLVVSSMAMSEAALYGVVQSEFSPNVTLYVTIHAESVTSIRSVLDDLLSEGMGRETKLSEFMHHDRDYHETTLSGFALSGRGDHENVSVLNTALSAAMLQSGIGVIYTGKLRSYRLSFLNALDNMRIYREREGRVPELSTVLNEAEFGEHMFTWKEWMQVTTIPLRNATLSLIKPVQTIAPTLHKNMKLAIQSGLWIREAFEYATATPDVIKRVPVTLSYKLPVYASHNSMFQRGWLRMVERMVKMYSTGRAHELVDALSKGISDSNNQKSLDELYKEVSSDTLGVIHIRAWAAKLPVPTQLPPSEVQIKDNVQAFVDAMEAVVSPYSNPSEIVDTVQLFSKNVSERTSESVSYTDSEAEELEAALDEMSDSQFGGSVPELEGVDTF